MEHLGDNSDVDEASEDLTGRLPIVPHETVAALIVAGASLLLWKAAVSNCAASECGGVLGVIQTEILKSLVGLDDAEHNCTHCGKLNVFPGFTTMKAYVCDGCVKAVEPEPVQSDSSELDSGD